jgi:Methyltransferase domain
VPSWLLKAATQGAISLLPGRHRLNRTFQERLTGSLVLTEARFEAKVAQCAHHLRSFRQVKGTDHGPRTAFELGTGWYPIVPVGLALAGAERVATIDVSPLLDRERVARVLDLYARALGEGWLDLPGVDHARAEALVEGARARREGSPAELLEVLGVTPLVGDARAASLPPGSIDLIVSNNVLEHIAADMLAGVLAELRRLAAPGAVMDHFIDHSDHYAHFDRSITEFNYLRYPPALWRLVNNRLHYQNRLRASDYRRLVERAGFRVVAEQSERGAASELAAVRLATPFLRYTQADLLVLRSWLTAVA